MRSFVLAFVFLGVVASSAYSQGNAPANVMLECVVPPVIVGFTSSLHNGKTGGIGGLWSMHLACDAEFPDSRMCSTRVRTEVLPPYPPLPVLGAWVDEKILINSCVGWSFDRDQLGIHGAVLTPGGGVDAVSCDQFRPILCCGR